MNKNVKLGDGRTSLFPVLANPSRVHILRTLCQGEMNVTQITDATGASQTLVSHHLKRLIDAGLAKVRNDGRYRYYSLHEDTPKPLLELIERDLDVEQVAPRAEVGYTGFVMMANPEKITKSEEQWRKELAPEQYRIIREKGTEDPFTGQYWKSKEKGMYLCAACGNELFSSETKFDSGTGWPSFWEPAASESVDARPDESRGMRRTEAACGRCGAHLGHVFEDGPEPTGKRYCINSASLKLKKAE